MTRTLCGWRPQPFKVMMQKRMEARNARRHEFMGSQILMLRSPNLASNIEKHFPPTVTTIERGDFVKRTSFFAGIILFAALPLLADVSLTDKGAAFRAALRAENQAKHA